MRRLTLIEYQTEPSVALSSAESDALRRIVPSLVVTPSIGKEGRYDLTPGSWVGAASFGSLSVEVRPKLSMSRVMFMISYSLDPRLWYDSNFGFAEENLLLEAIIPGFVVQVRKAVRGGVLQGYRHEEAALMTVRGRLRLDEQLRRRFGAFPPAEIAYDEFTDDIEENRLIKAALDKIRRMRVRSDAARRSLRAFDSALERIRLVNYDPRRLPEVSYTRLNEHYRPAVELAKLILRSVSIELHHGRVRSSAFFVDMNQVFEDFVVVALREALGAIERTFPQGGAGRRLFLDDDQRVRLKPDISWWDDGHCEFVGDAKYKRVVSTGVEHADLYQLLAYTIATGLPGGLLIYGAGETEPIVHTVQDAGKRLEIEVLDLSLPPAAILGQVQSVANKILSLRDEARYARAQAGALA